jgi:23S rRNA pseudouridine2605 synthase
LNQSGSSRQGRLRRRLHTGRLPGGKGEGPGAESRARAQANDGSRIRPTRSPVRPQGAGLVRSAEPRSIRVQKIIAQAGLASRREAEEWIREGRVSVNGAVARLGDRADPARDSIRVDGKRVTPRAGPKTYILLNKPKGYVTTVSDPHQRDTVLDLLPGGLKRGIKPVGRLDVQTEGLLLLTDDGDLARELTHPSSECPKEYRVKVSGQPSEKDLERLRRGVFLEGRKTKPATIERIPTAARGEKGNAWFRVVLTEGRNRQIRRMFESVGHPVSKLKRTGIGPIRDEGLPAGAHRRLSEKEVSALKHALRAPSRGA